MDKFEAEDVQTAKAIPMSNYLEQATVEVLRKFIKDYEEINGLQESKISKTIKKDLIRAIPYRAA